MKLTPRQRQVLELIGAQRRTYAEIAEELGISPRTVEDHARAIRDHAEIDGRPRDACLALWANFRHDD